jgi:hypothetical protein
MQKTGDKLSHLLSRDDSCIVLLHNTDSIARAKNIMSDRFRFESQLTYSTDRINPKDQVEINYFLVERKEYGDYTIVIEIDKKLFRQYSHLAESSEVNLEDILSYEEPYINDNDEYVYLLSHYYIKCIFNNKTGEVKMNPVFDPLFNSPDYIRNYNRLTK